MLATLVEEAFDDPAWIFELKWDGYRAVAECGKNHRLYSRNGLSFEHKYPAIFTAIKRIKVDCVLDGEIVLLNAEGKPDFQKLQLISANQDLQLVYYVFDLLELKGKDLKDIPLLKRKQLLEKLVKNNEKVIYCDHHSTYGIDYFEEVSKLDMEGIIAKRADSTYNEGSRSNDWLKIKFHKNGEAVIAGYTEPKGSRKHFGAIILGRFNRAGELIYIGHAGTGFNESRLKELSAKMRSLETGLSPFKTRIKVNSLVTWILPKLVCQVNYSEETRDGMLRHPVYAGLRADKKPAEVLLENEKPKSLSDAKRKK
jgi:bifunctional non-homologous end joining protein LigD